MAIIPTMQQEIPLPGYSWPEAREAIKVASYKKDEIEIPAIKNAIPWQGLEALELSRNSDIRLIIALNNQVKYTTLLLSTEEAVERAKRLIEKLKLTKQARVFCYNQKQDLPTDVSNNLYDVVYGEWLSHSLLENEQFLDKIIKMARKYFLIIMPSPESDDTKIASIKNPEEFNRRDELMKQILRTLRKQGFSPHVIEKELPLRYASAEQARKTYYTLAFSGKATPKQKQDLDDFLTEEKAKNISNRFYLLWAERTN